MESFLNGISVHRRMAMIWKEIEFGNQKKKGTNIFKWTKNILSEVENLKLETVISGAESI